LGRITEQAGFIQSSKHLLRTQVQQQSQQKVTNQENQQRLSEEYIQQKQDKLSLGSTKEFGFSNYILKYFKSFSLQLQKVFPTSWQHILLLVYCRLLSQ